MDNKLFSWLQDWYTSQCDGAWEEYYGIKISTISNPGWKVCIDLKETNFEHLDFSALKIDRSEHDWLHCQVAESQFLGSCGPLNLVELLDLFRSWAEAVTSNQD